MTSKSFQELAKGIADLVTEKEKAYGSAFDKAGDFLKLLYPNGIKPEQYKDMLCVVRMFDKLMRISTSYEGTEEKKVDAYSDLTGYGLLGLRSSLEEQTVKQNVLNKQEQEQVKHSEKPSEQSKIDPFSGIEAARWQALAFPETIPIGEELNKNLRKQDKDDFLRGRNRPTTESLAVAKKLGFDIESRDK